jgi:hypothetical protein
MAVAIVRAIGVGVIRVCACQHRGADDVPDVRSRAVAVAVPLFKSFPRSGRRSVREGDG